MELIQDPIYEGNVTVRCTIEELEAKQQQKIDAARTLYASNPKAAAETLYKIAVTDTGGGRAASALLLSLWNNNFAANMRDVVSSLDTENSEAAMALLTTLGPCHHLERYLSDEHIQAILYTWGDTHLKNPR